MVRFIPLYDIYFAIRYPREVARAVVAQYFSILILLTVLFLRHESAPPPAPRQVPRVAPEGAMLGPMRDLFLLSPGCSQLNAYHYPANLKVASAAFKDAIPGSKRPSKYANGIGFQ